MPLLRRLIKIGHSRAITIPPDWIRHQERLTGGPIEEILLDIGDSITISVNHQQDNHEKEVSE